MPTLANGRTAVYRAFNTEGRLLYIGIARNWGERWANHARRSTFFDSTSRLEVEWCESREAALQREAELVKDLAPAYNERLNPGNAGPAAAELRAPDPAADLEPGWWVAIAFRRPIAGLWCHVGQVQQTTSRGIRITLMDWMIGAACGWDSWVPWDNIEGVMVATDEHDLSTFGGLDGRAASFQTRCQPKDTNGSAR